LERDEAYKLAKSRFSNLNLFKHVLAVEAVMRDLAEHFGEDQEKWGLVGLLHDLDYEETMKTPERHSIITAEILQEQNIDDDIIHAIKCHNNLAPRQSSMDNAIYVADPITGLIVAATLMHPSKKLKQIDVPFVLRRFKEKAFARSVDRDQLKKCEDLNLSLEEFFDISIKAMQKIDKELGL